MCMRMKRFLILSLGGLLIVCLAFATSAAGYFQATHEIARVGQTTLVICGQNGQAEVTLDQNGTPVDPVESTCGHCTHGTLISGFDLPSAAAFPRKAVQTQLVAGLAAETIRLISRQAIKMPRAPPSKVIS